MQKISSRLERVVPIGDEVYHYEFTFGDTPIAFQPGQFFLMEVLDDKDPKCTRAFSLASAPAEDMFSLCIKLIPGGRASEYLRNIKVGDVLNFGGPYGHFIAKDEERKAAVNGLLAAFPNMKEGTSRSIFAWATKTFRDKNIKKGKDWWKDAKKFIEEELPPEA